MWKVLPCFFRVGTLRGKSSKTGALDFGFIVDVVLSFFWYVFCLWSFLVYGPHVISVVTLAQDMIYDYDSKGIGVEAKRNLRDVQSPTSSRIFDTGLPADVVGGRGGPLDPASTDGLAARMAALQGEASREPASPARPPLRPSSAGASDAPPGTACLCRVFCSQQSPLSLMQSPAKHACAHTDIVTLAIASRTFLP